MKEQSELTFTKLPNEVLALILAYANPKSANLMITYNLCTNIDANWVWGMQLKKDFPGFVSTADNYALFKLIQQSGYKHLPEHQQKWFSYLLAKDCVSFNSSISELSELEEGSSPLKGSFIRIQPKTFLPWLQKLGNQIILDTLYEFIKTHYTTSDGSFNLEKKDNQGRNILYWAVQCHQSVETIKAFSALDNSVYSNYKTIMHVALKQGLLALVDHFITLYPAWLEIKTEYQRTPLFFAVENKQEQLVEYFLAKKASMPTNLRASLIKLSIDNNTPGILEKLLGAGLTINTENVIYSASIGRWEILKFLVGQYPQMLECTDIDGKTPLYYAILNHHLPTITYLLTKKANVNVTSRPRYCQAQTLYEHALRLPFAVFFELIEAGMKKSPIFDFIKQLTQYVPNLLDQMSQYTIIPQHFENKQATFLLGPDGQLYVATNLGLEKEFRRPTIYHKIANCSALGKEILGSEPLLDAFKLPKQDNLFMYIGILELNQPHLRLNLVNIHNTRGNTVFHEALDDLDSFKKLLELIPIEQRLEAIRLLNKRGSSVLQYALEFSDELLKLMLPLLEPAHQHIVVNTPNRFGLSFIQSLSEDEELSDWLAHVLPKPQKPTKPKPKEVQENRHSHFQPVVKKGKEEELLFSISL